ncbi:hypothetical protein AB0C87_24770 [Actinomadura sp. NPDC048021]|uniref:hypothetical protein n=1 Tax=Actinomadura sp. NPDC048021 TaxID=3155385 RepID=UPI0033C7E209
MLRGYIATFNDASYNSLGSIEDVGEWFPSIAEAKRALSDRYHLGRSDVIRPAWDGYGHLLNYGWEEDRFDFPSVTEKAHFDLYPVYETSYGATSSAEPTIRLDIGPRGGIQRHNF